MKKKILIVFLICCMLFGVASPALAYSVTDIDVSLLPAPPNDYGSYYVFKNSINYVDVVVMDIQPYIKLSSDTYLLLSSDGTNFKSAYYRWRDDGDGFYWDFESVKTDWRAGVGTLPPLGANFNLLDENGELFFPRAPLVDLTEELIQMTTEALDLDGKMRILVPFGISCLALLISLPLLLRVLRRFLG